MQDLAVAPGSLEGAGAALRVAADEGTTRLARAIVDDVCVGFGNRDIAMDLDGTLPRVVSLLGEQATVMGHQLSTAAGSYRRAEWLAQLALEAAR